MFACKHLPVTDARRTGSPAPTVVRAYAAPLGPRSLQPSPFSPSSATFALYLEACCFRLDIFDLLRGKDQQTANSSIGQCPVFGGHLSLTTDTRSPKCSVYPYGGSYSGIGPTSQCGDPLGSSKVKQLVCSEPDAVQ